MGKRPYKLNLKTPSGECSACAETLDGLVEVSPLSLRVGEQDVKTDSQKMEQAARALYAKYLEARKNKGRTPPTNIWRAGCELDLIRCYLSGTTIPEAVEWLKKNKNVSTSRSAIGRYWQLLNTISGDFKALL
jgi:hypothetical protein